MIFDRIALEDILVDLTENYRTNIDDSSVRDLHKSFVAVHERTNGARWMLNPVDLVKLKKPVDGKKYKLLIGFRRMLAAQYTLDQKPKKYAWAQQVPAMVREEDDEMQPGAGTLMAMVENIQREDVNPLDEANACKKILDETGMSMSELGKKLGRSKGWVAQRTSLLKLSDEVQGALAAGKVDFSHARELGRLKNSEAQDKMLDLVDMNGWDARTTKDHVKSVLDDDPTPQAQCVYDVHESPTGGASKTASKDKKAKGDSDEGNEGDSPNKKDLSMQVREITALVDKVKQLENKFNYAEKQKKETKVPDKKAAFEQQSAFYAGAQTGIAYALGEVDDVSVSEIFYKDKND